MTKVSNVLLDFGNVLYKVNLLAAITRFSSLTGVPLLRSPKMSELEVLAENYEKGVITTPEFRFLFSKLFDQKFSDDDFDKAWNAILVGLFPYSFRAVNSIKKNHKLFLLSNTSPLHYDIFKTECGKVFERFDKLYFSYQIGIRKPNLKAFEYVLEDSGIKAEDTLFADDLEENLLAAEKVGFKTVLIDSHFTLSDLAKSLKCL